MSVYLTLVPCANSRNLTSYFEVLQHSLHSRRGSKVAYPVETHGLYDQVDKSLGPTEADERKPRTGLLGAQVYDDLV